MTENLIQIYLELTPEDQLVFSDNGISIDEILREMNLPAHVAYGVIPDVQEEEARSKDPALIILASAAVIVSIGYAISQVLHTLGRQPRLVEFYEFVEVKDTEGNVLLDKRNKPILRRVKKYDFLEPRKEDSKNSLEFNLNPVNGLVIKFGSSEKQMEEKKTTQSK